MRYDRVRREYAEVGVGKELWGFVVEVCSRVARRYPPATYNYDETWGPEAFEDLAQQLILERLLPNGQEQLAYVMTESETEDELGRLVAHHVRRTLAQRRGVSVTDRLLRRIRGQVASGSYLMRNAGGADFLCANDTVELRPLTDTERREGVVLISSVPRLPTSAAATRESMIYTPANLHEVEGRLVARFGAIALEDIRRIFEELLTPWLPTTLRNSEETHRSEVSTELETERGEMEQRVLEVAHEMDPTRRRILVGKVNRVSDSQLADELKCSRPTVAKQGKAALAEVRELVSDLPVEYHEEAVAVLLEHLAVAEEST